MIHRVYFVNVDYTLCTSAIRPVQVVYFIVRKPYVLFRLYTSLYVSHTPGTKFGAYIRPYITDDTKLYLVYTDFMLYTSAIRPVNAVYFIVR